MNKIYFSTVFFFLHIFSNFSYAQVEVLTTKDAKAICLMKDPLIRGEKLSECIKKEIEDDKLRQAKKSN